MDPSFWQQRWSEGRIGFHQQQVTPLLEKHWEATRLEPGACIFVPLAGKSLDMLWLAARGYRVLAAELSPLAVGQFFAENGLTPALRESPLGVHHVAGEIEVICGDVFALDAAALAGCAGVYDRAALIALPPGMRRRYAAQVYGSLPANCRGLLITLDYPQQEKSGPPFSVDTGEVRALFEPAWTVDLLTRNDILATQPGFVAEGVTDLHTAAYRLQRN